MDRRSPIALLISVLGLGCTARTQQGHALPVTSGPLVCFTTIASSDPHELLLHVANCDGDGRARPFWRNRGNVDVVARLDRTRILIASYGEPYALIVVDTSDGSHRVLAEGSPHDFVAIHGAEVLYLGDNRGNKGDHHLYARSWQQGGPRRRLAEPLFDAVPIVHGNLAIGVTAGERQVWSISLTSDRSRKLCDLPENAMQVRLALSPGGQRVAIGASLLGTGYLAAVDLGSSKVLRQWQDLNIDVSPLSSFTPTVEVGWFDDDTVVTSETVGAGPRGQGGNFAFVRRSLASGKVTDETAYGPVQLMHRAPDPPGRQVPASPTFFVAREADRRLLMQKGTKQPLQSVPIDHRAGGAIRLAPGGAFALVQLAHNPRQCVLYRAGQKPLAVFDGSATDYSWLPAAR